MFPGEATSGQKADRQKVVGFSRFLNWFSFGMAPLTFEMAVNSASRPFGRKSVAAVAEPAKFKAEKANKGHKQEPAASKKGLERPVSFWGDPVISMHFLRGNSFPIGPGQCRARAAIKRACKRYWRVSRSSQQACYSGGAAL